VDESLKILVVDDDLDIIEILKYNLNNSAILLSPQAMESKQLKSKKISSWYNFNGRYDAWDDRNWSVFWNKKDWSTS